MKRPDKYRSPQVRENVRTAPLTTLEVGGKARYLVDATTDAEVEEALRWAGDERLPVTVLAGGSNVVVADAGVDGALVRIATRGIDVRIEGETAKVTIAAGEPWDDVVAEMVDRNLAGLECLAGIPGTAGATPIQNVGAYGQEVAEVLDSVTVIDRSTLRLTSLVRNDLQLSYRSSLLKRNPDRYVVLAVTFGLSVNGAAAVRYPELAKAVDISGPAPSLAAVRDAVLELRRSKSMVIDPADPNHRSVGSFFTNPVVEADRHADVTRRAAERGWKGEVPSFPAEGGSVKIPAAWLIERAGFGKGQGEGPVGLSTRHTLAVVNRGGATADQVVGFARRVRTAVHERFGILLQPEPVFLGFDSPNPLDEPE